MGRKKPEVLKKTKPIFYIFCGGLKTEVNYFKLQLQKKGLSTNGVIGKGIDPKRLLEIAKEKYESKANIDQVWIVIDKDNFEIEDFNSTINNCNNNDIGCSWSNPCFELWFWLHVKDVNGKFNTKSCIEKFSKDFQSTFGIEYSKTNLKCIELLNSPENRELAINRAKKLVDIMQSSKDYNKNNYSEHNPYTTVYKLVENILNNSL